MSVRGIPTDILLRGVKKWNRLFNFSWHSCHLCFGNNSRKEKGILTLNSGCCHWNQMEIEMKLQPGTNSKKISHIVQDLQTSYLNYKCTWRYWSFKPPIRYQDMEPTAKGSATERLDGNFLSKHQTATEHWLNNKIETKYLPSALGSQRGQTEIEHRIY